MAKRNAVDLSKDAAMLAREDTEQELWRSWREQDRAAAALRDAMFNGLIRVPDAGASFEEGVRDVLTRLDLAGWQITRKGN